MRLAALALLIAMVVPPARADVLGSFDRVDLYRALIVDAGSHATAARLLDAAMTDRKITLIQLGELAKDVDRNWPPEVTR